MDRNQYYQEQQEAKRRHDRISRLIILFSVEVLSRIDELNVVTEWLCDDNDLMPLNLLLGKDNGVRLLPVDQ
jgi:hypothetical protein